MYVKQKEWIKKAPMRRKEHVTQIHKLKEARNTEENGDQLTEQYKGDDGDTPEKKSQGVCCCACAQNPL